GWGLLALALAWLLGRLAPWWPGVPPLAMACLDLAFWLGLACYVARVIIAAGNRRNALMVVVMALLFGVNLLIQLDFMGLLPGVARHGERLAIDLVVLLMVVVAGRITPAFTANWLERQGGQRAWVRQSPCLDGLAIAATSLLIPVDAWGGDPRIAASVALLAAVLNALRLACWAGRRCLGERLLWVLHLGSGSIVAALVPTGLAPWLPGVSALLWLHAAGVGAMGTLILGVMSRVALGHTGRPLALPRGAVLFYGLISLAAV